MEPALGSQGEEASLEVGVLDNCALQGKGGVVFGKGSLVSEEEAAVADDAPLQADGPFGAVGGVLRRGRDGVCDVISFEADVVGGVWKGEAQGIDGCVFDSEV